MEALRYLGLLALFVFLAGFIVFIGWDEPLRYRFMSPVAIAAEERALRPVPEPQSEEESRAQVAAGTALDRAPWRRDRRGRVRYSPEFDTRTMGTPTETRERQNLFSGEGAR
jgi:hypothetical protein